MPQVVEVPGMGDVEFPDDMSDEQIASAIRANTRPAAPQGLPQGWSPNQYPPGFTPQPNPFGQQLIGGMERLNQAAGVTAQPKETDVAAMIPEVALQAGTGLLGTIGGGLAGIGQGVWNQTAGRISPDLKGPDAADRVRQIQQGTTYQPRTAGGQMLSATVGLPGQVLGKGTTYLGEKTAEVTGSPLVGAGVKTVGDILPSLIAARSLPKRDAPEPRGKFVDTKNSVPTTEQLRKETNAAYKRGKESGVMVKADEYARAADEITESAKEEALDPVLHPKSSRIVQVLQERKGKDLDLQEAENLRRIALEAEGDVNNVGQQTGDGRIAGKIVDDLDDKIDALSVNAEARALNRRKANSQLLDVMVDRAQTKAGANYTQSGLENALRKEFQALALNTRRMKRLTEAQQEAIKRVARGGKMENTLRNLGKFDPTTGGMGTAISMGLGGGLAIPTGGLSLLLPAIGFASKRGATKMAESNVDAAREALVGRGVGNSTLGGLLAKGEATKPLVGQRGLLGGSAPRSVAQLRSEIASLDAEVQRLQAAGPAASTVRASVEAELARLQKELADVEAQGGLL
jgi:hypothetical protein